MLHMHSLTHSSSYVINVITVRYIKIYRPTPTKHIRTYAAKTIPSALPRRSPSFVETPEICKRVYIFVANHY